MSRGSAERHDSRKRKPQLNRNRAFREAYDFFNRELFAGSLPPVPITLRLRGPTYGLFSVEARSIGRGIREAAYELALNPRQFERTDEILSTLVHEMTHVWQVAHGAMPRSGNHDKQWAAKMNEIGLQPSTTGEPGGKETGRRVSHYVIDGGPFACALARLKGTGFKLRWPGKTEFICPKCRANTWAKPRSLLFCGACLGNGELEIHVMLEQTGDDHQAEAA